MSLPTYTPSFYTGAGSTATYSYGFRILQDSDLQVIVTDLSGNETTLALTTDYTVTGAGDVGGGTITLVAGNLTSGYLLSIKRVVALTQPTVFRNQGAFSPDRHEDAMDRMVMIDQQLNEELARCFRAAGGSSGIDYELPPLQAGYALGVNPTADGLVMVANTGADQSADLANTSDVTKGDSLLGVKQTSTGSVARTQHGKNEETVSVLDFGADPTGATDSTLAFNAAKTALAPLGGGIVRIPRGTYSLVDFVLDDVQILYVGETSGFGYEEVTSSVTLIPGTGATFVARLKGTKTGVVINAARASGFKNVVFDCPTRGAVDYGLFIDSGATLLEEVTIQNFKYGCVMADQINSNRFKNCAFVLNTQVGIGICEASANSYINPGVTSITSVSNTAWTMEGCLVRQNGFGMVIRSSVNCYFSNCVFESNDQAGIYIYRPDDSTVRMLNFVSCWCENNYQAYTSGSTSFSITGNRFFLIGGSSTYIAWTSLLQAGYQMVIDSQTHYGGGADTFEFNMCAFNCNGVQQKAIKILSGFKFNFRKPWFANGDIDNLVSITSDAEAVHWYDPLSENDPVALVKSITDTFGAGAGTRGAYYKSGTSFGTAEIGGIYPILGATGGPVHFLTPVASDPRRAEPRCLDDYYENDTYTIAWRTESAIPFTVSAESNSVTKIGRLVHLEMEATLTVNATTGAAAKLYTTGTLPYQCAATGSLVGRAWVQVVGGATAVVNSGICDLWMDSVAGLYGVVDVFPALTIGHAYTIKVTATYISAT